MALLRISVVVKSGQHCAEICICELFGVDSSSDSSVVQFGVHPFHDPDVADDFRALSLPIDTGEFHVYAVEWAPDSVTFFVDNEEVGVVHQSLPYRMQFMLGLYELPERTPSGTAYPKSFKVDYFRGYQPAEGYATKHG